MEKALSAISDSEVSGLIDGLSLEECDLLMKYVYKMMSVKSSCSTMLKMHAKLVEKAGLGSIVRAMTDRKQV